MIQKDWILQIQPNEKNYNDGHNILRIFDAIPSFLFTTNEAKRD